MRKMLAAIFLSSVALPAVAIAAPDDGESRSERRSAIIEKARESREQRSEQSRSERPVVKREAPVQRVEPSSRGNDSRSSNEERRERIQQVLRERGERVTERDGSEGERRPSGDSVRDWRRGERSVSRRPRLETPSQPDEAQPQRETREILADRVRDRGERSADRRDERPEGFRNLGNLENRILAEHFRREWRRDDRYDWRRHRDRHRNVFRLGWYRDPFGWGYRRWQIGWNIWPSYWNDHYWLRDPWQWRLPTVHGPYRWIRYYDDALLVDLRTGRVVDVIYDVFW